MDDFYVNVGLSYSRRTGNDTEGATYTMTGENAEYLPNVLSTMVTFLQAMGFTYVTDLNAVCESGRNNTKIISASEAE